MPEKWVLRVYAMGCAIPDCYEFKNQEIAKSAMQSSCDGILAREVFLIHVNGEQTGVADHWKYSDGPRVKYQHWN
jgi:hypothetical protein